jgi:hypothetical protein
MRLIDEALLASNEDIRRRMASLPVVATPLPAPFDRIFQNAMRAYVLLTKFPAAVLQHSYSAEEVFWSRWYWIQRCVKLRNALGKNDAGLEQEAFKVIESYDYQYSDSGERTFDTPDWEARAEMLEARAARDVQELITRKAE